MGMGTDMYQIEGAAPILLMIVCCAGFYVSLLDAQLLQDSWFGLYYDYSLQLEHAKVGKKTVI